MKSKMIDSTFSAWNTMTPLNHKFLTVPDMLQVLIACIDVFKVKITLKLPLFDYLKIIWITVQTNLFKMLKTNRRLFKILY